MKRWVMTIAALLLAIGGTSCSSNWSSTGTAGTAPTQDTTAPRGTSTGPANNATDVSVDTSITAASFVSSTIPSNNETDVAVDSPITATFSEELDASTITTATFTEH